MNGGHGKEERTDNLQLFVTNQTIESRKCDSIL